MRGEGGRSEACWKCMVWVIDFWDTDSAQLLTL
jgi:hypothetical protein